MLVLTRTAGAMSGWRPAPTRDAVIAAMAPMLDRNVTPELQKVRHHGHGQPELCHPSDALHPGASQLGALAVQHDAAGKLDHGLWRHRHRRADPSGRLLQLHEPGHGARHAAGARDRAAQDHGRQPPPADRPVPGRSGADGAAGAGAGLCHRRNAAAGVRQFPGASDRLRLCHRLAAAAGAGRRRGCRGPDQRQLSGAGAVGLPARRHLAHQQRRAGRLGRLAQSAGGAAVRGFHRAGHRRRRGVQPDQLCPQYRSGLSSRQYPHHGQRPPDRRRAAPGLRCRRCAPIPASSNVGMSNYMPFDDGQSLVLDPGSRASRDRLP